VPILTIGRSKRSEAPMLGIVAPHRLEMIRLTSRASARRQALGVDPAAPAARSLRRLASAAHRSAKPSRSPVG